MADTPIPVDEGAAPEAKASVASGKRTRKLPSSSTNDDDGGIKSDSEQSYHQAKKPRTAKARHPRGVPWFTMLERLKQYKVKHGTFNVPRILADDQKLASWVHYQRYLFHHKTIAEERKAALDALGFEWTIADSKVGNRVSWDEHLVRLQTYKERFGDCLVPYTYKDDKSLAYWVSRQRKDNNKGLLPEDKVAKLEAIGFAWNPTLGRRWSKNKEQRSRTTNWDGQFEKLKALHDLSAGGTDLRSLIEQDKSLEAWMKNQRYLYSVKRMAADRVEKLDSINFVWRIGISWNDYLVRLKNHKDTTGSFENIDDPKLAEWRDCQRIAYSFKELKKDKVDQLNAIEFVWDSDKVVASQEEWKSVMKNEDAALLASMPQATVTPGHVKPPPKPMLYAKAPKGLDEKMPALPGQGAATDPSPEEMAEFLEEHVILDPAHAGAAQPTAVPDVADANMQEYNIAMHLAGLAETKQQKGAETPGGTESAAAGKIQHETQAGGENDKQGGLVKEETSLDRGGEDNAVSAEVEEAELSTQEKLVLLQEEIVTLREEKVKLQEERVKVQKDKEQLRVEIEAIGFKNESLGKPEDTAVSGGAQSSKKELEDQVKANEELMKTQATQIKEREEKIQKLLAEAAGEGITADDLAV